MAFTFKHLHLKCLCNHHYHVQFVLLTLYLLAAAVPSPSQALVTTDWLSVSAIAYSGQLTYTDGFLYRLMIIFPLA